MKIVACFFPSFFAFAICGSSSVGVAVGFQSDRNNNDDDNNNDMDLKNLKQRGLKIRKPVMNKNVDALLQNLGQQQQQRQILPLPETKIRATGKSCTIVGWNDQTKRATVEVSHSQVVDIVNLDHLILPPGARVRIRGLQSRAALAFNGKRGIVEGWDDSRGRYKVKFGKNEKPKNVKPENVTFESEILPQGAHVQIHGLRSHLAFNGKRGVVEGWDDSRGRYKVKFGKDGKPKNVKPENVILESGILPQGAHVQIHGLQSHLAFNGKRGIVEGWDDSRGRYKVKFGKNEKHKNVKVRRTLLLSRRSCRRARQGMRQSRQGMRHQLRPPPRSFRHPPVPVSYNRF